MELRKSNIIIDTIANLQKKTGGTPFVDLQDDTCLAGLIVKGLKYDEDYVIRKISSMKNKLKLESFGHLMIGDKIICFQLDVNNKIKKRNGD